MTGEADEPLNEAEALTLWCARLPELREHARVTGVTDRLDREAVRVRDGGSARQAVRKWLPREDARTTRGWSDRGGAGGVGFPGAVRTPAVTAGRYICPAGRCDRIAARDAQGHVPVCHAAGVAMSPAV